MPGRILYLCPDLPHPSGGVAAVYDHVRILDRHGFPAFVLHFEAGHAHPFAGPPPPLLHLGAGAGIGRQDVLVIPEGCLFDELRSLAGIRKFAFVQSCLYAFDGPGDPGLWRDLGLAGALCCSELTAVFAREVLGLAEVRIVPNAVDPALFAPGDKTLSIAFMPRKQPAEIRFLRRAFTLRNPRWADIPWIPIDGLDRAGVARAMGSSAVFLSTCLYEGFGLPALEAMACGCLVAGFHGYGGLEYVSDANGLWCAQGDLLACLAALERAVALHLEDGPQAAGLRREARATAARYSPQGQETALLAMWQDWHGRE